MSYQNYYGSWLPKSGSPSNWLNGSPYNTLYGTSQNDQIGGGGTYDTLAGGAGDDYYWLRDDSEKVVEQAGQGIDTIKLWQSYTLPANVENLIIFGNGNTATGNNLDNIIQGLGSGETLYGGLGSDVLIGSQGAGDTYLIVKGEGAKAIQGFLPGAYSSDVIRLAGSNLSTFDQVKGAMTQVGNDVVVNNGGEPLVIRGVQVNQFVADDFQLPFNPSSLGAPVFDDEFNGLQFSDATKGLGASTGWWPNFGGAGSNSLETFTLPRNNEQQIYTSPMFQGTTGSSLGLNPFSINNGVLTISATQLNSTQSSQMWGYKYASGALTTEWSHLQQYGYFEVRAQLPTGQGMWPAFWLVGPGTEIDALEAVGSQPNQAYVGFHSPSGGDHTLGVYTTPTSDGFHTYGVLWTPTSLAYYVDGSKVWDQPTPADMNQPMYMILNLAVGGGWAGSPDGTTPWPAQLKVDYVRAYAIPGVTVGSSPAGSGSPTGGSGSGSSGSGSSGSGSSGSGSSGSGSSGSSGAPGNSSSTYTLPQGTTSVTLTGSSQTVTGNDQGDTFYSNNTGNHLIGGSGADTFYIGRGGDTVSGGAGADSFVFNENPYSGGHITDFSTADHIDISPTLQKAGYTGNDPVGDGYVKIGADGSGNAQVFIDPTGHYGGGGWWLATTLDGVSSSSLSVHGGTITTSASASSGSGSTAPSGSGGTGSTAASTYTVPQGTTSITLTGAGQTVTGNDQGDTFYSNNGSNHLIGGSGNDTFYIGRAGDTVKGGAGADTFVFNENPYNGGHITDFSSADRIDISPTLQRAGYTGNDPVGAGYVRIGSDNAGNAEVFIDPNGHYGAGGWWMATVLDGVSVSSVSVHGGTITTSASGGGGQPSSGGSEVTTWASSYTAPWGTTTITLGGSGQTVTGNDQGDTFYSNNGANHLIGGAGNDTFHIGRAGDTVTGGAGADAFTFDENPWNAGHITDFNPWQDHIDLTATLQKAGYTGNDPIGAGYVRIGSDGGGNAQVWIDPNGWYGAGGWWLATTLDGVSASNLHEHGGWLAA